MTFLSYLLIILLGILVHPLCLLLAIPVLLYVNYKSQKSEPDQPLSTPRSYTLKPSSYVATNPSDPRTLKFQARKKAYMNSPAWFHKKQKVLARDRHTCQICGSTSNLVVHHMRDYMLIPNEPISSLITLCQTCHQRQHDSHDPLRTYEDYVNWNTINPRSTHANLNR